jgi:hypothetical protein
MNILQMIAATIVNTAIQAQPYVANPPIPSLDDQCMVQTQGDVN